MAIGHQSVRSAPERVNYSEVNGGLFGGPTKSYEIIRLFTTSFGAPSRIRTWDLRLRRPLLYPTELRAPEGQMARSVRAGFYIAPRCDGGKGVVARSKCDGNRFIFFLAGVLYGGISARSE